MKKIFFSCLFLLFISGITLYAQGLEVCLPTLSSSSCKKALPLSNEDWLLVGSEANPNVDSIVERIFIARIDKNGKVLWQKSLDNTSTNIDKMVLDSAEQNLYFVTWEWFCDVGGDVEVHSFNLEKQTHTKIISTKNYANYEAATEALLQLPVPMELKARFKYSYQNLFKIKDNRFCFFNYSKKTLCEIRYPYLDTITIANNTSSFGDLAALMPYDTTHYVWLASEELHVLNKQFNSISGFLLPSNHYAQKLLPTNDPNTFWIIFYIPDEMYKIAKLSINSTFVLSLSEEQILENSQINFINNLFIHNNKPYIATSFHSAEVPYFKKIKDLSEYGGNHFLFKALDAASFQSQWHKDDVGISNVKINTLPIKLEDNTRTLFPEITVTLTNYGSTIVNNAMVDCRFPFINGICAFTNYYSKTLENINLAPGASLEVVFQNLNPFTFHLAEPYQICFWSNLPNLHVDAHPENDVFCQKIVSTPTAELSDAEISLFPNPSSETLFVKSYKLLSTSNLLIYNVLGQIVGNYELEDNTENSIDVNMFPIGNYYYTLLNEGVLLKRGVFSVLR
jgi:Secretion system C-terminal sorting domain